MVATVGVPVMRRLLTVAVAVCIALTNIGLADAAEGGPDYGPLGGPTVELQAVVLPDLVVIDGETVPAALDLPVWLALADCEWKASWHARTTGNGFYGRFQWLLTTWRSLTATVGFAFPDEAPIAVQLDAAREALDRGGWGQWPGCSRRLHLSR